MDYSPEQMIQKSNQWLQNTAIPLWLAKGIDPNNHGFIEALSKNSEPLTNKSRRALVQARQVYSFSTAAKMKALDHLVAKNIIANSLTFLKNYESPSGAYYHSVSADGKPDNLDFDLYTQAFVLFDLSVAYENLKEPSIEQKAFKVLNYLNSERKAKNGGYTEIKNNVTFYQSNPHMHLFEAALSWMSVSNNSVWADLAKNVYTLCLNYFYDEKTKTLGEHFHEGWIPDTSPSKNNSAFIFEPGHHFEWAWLLSWYQDLTGTDCLQVRHSLYATATQYGVDTQTHLTFDEVFSNHEIHKKSSRFWPQCERIKACVKLAQEVNGSNKANYLQAADEALQALFIYLDTPAAGLWQDTRLQDGSFTDVEPKASSLYHIINALYEYTNLRLK